VQPGQQITPTEGVTPATGVQPGQQITPTEGVTPATGVQQQPATGEGQVMVPQMIRLSDLMDFPVRNQLGEDLGNVEDMLVDFNDSRIHYIVITWGGFLGLGQNWYAIPWNQLRLDILNNTFLTDLTEAQIEAAPSFDRDAWPNITAEGDWDTGVQEYWQTQPQPQPVQPGVQPVQPGTTPQP
jgi:sporulation protein YlmC with PRC-barrel domain